MIKNDDYNWNLNELFIDMEDYQNQCKYVIECSKKLLSYGNNTCNNEKNIYEYYKLLEDIKIMLQKLSIYPILKCHQNVFDISSLKLCNNFKEFEKEIIKNISNIECELKKVNLNSINSISYNKYSKKCKSAIYNIKNSKKDEIDVNKALDIICKQKYNYKDIYNTLTLLDFDFEDISNGERLNYNSYKDIMKQSDVIIKNEAFCKFLNEYKSYINTITDIYCKYVKNDMLYSYIMGYSNHIEYLNDINGIDYKIYKNIICKLHDNVVVDDYIKVKKRYLEIENLHIYDIEYMNKECDLINIDFYSARDLIIDSLSVFGKDYKDILNMAFNNNWINLKDKDSAYNNGYCINIYSIHPFIFENYENNIKSLYKLNKDVSYAIYMYFSSRNQSYFQSEAPQIMLEVVSMVNEILITENLIEKNINVEIKKGLLISLIDKIVYAITKQSIQFEFEDYVYYSIGANINLSSDELCKKYINIIKKYFNNNIVIDENLKYEWARNIGFSDRIYDQNSAIVVCIALCIAEKVKKRDEEFLNRYIDLLKSGSSRKTPELLNSIGINLYETCYIDSAIKNLKNKINALNNFFENY